MARPVIYLTFANQADHHLALLKKEMDEVKDALRPLETRDFIRVEREESARVQDIVKTLSAYPDQVAIFHFAGHAASERLELEGGDAVAGGLAKLLGEQQQLQLVFLNGCSTREQVKLLFAAGVKAVIATSVPVEDDKALTFSEAFYLSLANKRSISRAFEFAKSAVEMKYRDCPDIEVVRGLDLDAGEEAKEMPWVLYSNGAEGEKALHWRMPYYREVGLPTDMISYIGERFKLNRYIVLVLDEMCRYNKDIYSQMVEIREGEEVKRDSSTYLDLVIQNFPWPIGSQIQLLRQKNRPDQERLEQLVSTYLITSQMLYFILLSDCWDEKRRLNFAVPQGFLKAHTLTSENIKNFDFLGKLLDIYRLLTERQASLFIPELEGFCEKLQGETHLAKAWKYLEKLRQDLGAVHPDTIEKQCVTTEQAVAVVLREAAFLADYLMLTVRNISINNPRYGKEEYDINLGKLNAIVSTSLSLYEDQEKRRKDTYSNCRSIVLTPNERDLRQSLNLSPFIIDKNTFLANDHIDLFIFGFEKEQVYHYLAVKHSFFLALKNEKGTDIIDTGMSTEDFLEGRNINKATEVEEDFGFGEAFGSGGQEVLTRKEAKVFAMLEAQFEQFKTDMEDGGRPTANGGQ